MCFIVAFSSKAKQVALYAPKICHAANSQRYGEWLVRFVFYLLLYISYLFILFYVSFIYLFIFYCRFKILILFACTVHST